MEINGSKLHTVKSIIDNSRIKPNLKTYLTNRKSNTTDLAWGTSMLIELYDTSMFDIGDDLKIYSETSTESFEILNIINNILIVSSISQNGVIFNDYKDSISEKEYKVFSGMISATIKTVNEQQIYNKYKVTMESMTPLNVNFGSDLEMMIDSGNNIIIYNMSFDFYRSIGDWLKGGIFNLVLNKDNTTLIRGLKYTETLNDYNYLVFQFETQSGTRKVLFTPKSIQSDYAVFSDYYFDEDVFFNVTTDPESPILFQSYVESSYANIDDTTNQIDTKTYFTRCINTGDVLKQYSWNGSSEDDNSVTIEDITEYNDRYITGFEIANGASVITSTEDKTKYLFLGKADFIVEDKLYQFIIKDYNWDGVVTTVTIDGTWSHPSTTDCKLSNEGKIIISDEIVSDTISSDDTIIVSGDITNWLWRQNDLAIMNNDVTHVTISSYSYNVTTDKTTIMINETLTTGSTVTIIFTVKVFCVENTLHIISDSVKYARDFGMTKLLVYGNYVNLSTSVKNYRIAGVALKDDITNDYDSIFISYIPLVNVEIDEQKIIINII